MHHTQAPVVRGSAHLALRLLASFLLAFWAAFLLLPLAGLGGVSAGRAGTVALALAAVVVSLGYLALAAGDRHREARRRRYPRPR